MSTLRRPALGHFAVMSAALLLAACATPGPVVSPPSSTASAQFPRYVSAPKARHAPGLNELAGLHQPDVLALLGKPDFTLDEPPAELWQYRAADCVLNLFFYREPHEFRLVRAEAWQRGPADNGTSTPCRDGTAPLKAHLLQSRL
jgi:hypothetical protein